MNAKLLESIQDRVLWLSIELVNHANSVRTNRSDLKVGGHQTSSSSVVTILTYLYFELLEKYDYVSIKPHASPVFHAIQYLLDNWLLLKNGEKESLEENQNMKKKINS